MKILKFSISGPTAFFKNPTVNDGTKLTFESIHKNAIFGIIGAIKGYGGHTQQYNILKQYKSVLEVYKKEEKRLLKPKKIDEEKLKEVQVKIAEVEEILEKNSYPEFYQKLKDIEVSIVETNADEMTKALHYYTCTNGSANIDGGVGLTYIASEQWIENPAWDIYLKSNDEQLLDEIYEVLKTGKYVYVPYLGNNTHPCNIDNIELFTEFEYCKDDDIIVDSIICTEDEDLFDETTKRFYLPISLHSKYNHYEYGLYFSTDEPIKNIPNLIEVDNKILHFV